MYSKHETARGMINKCAHRSISIRRALLAAPQFLHRKYADKIYTLLKHHGKNYRYSDLICNLNENVIDSIFRFFFVKTTYPQQEDRDR